MLGKLSLSVVNNIISKLIGFAIFMLIGRIIGIEAIGKIGIIILCFSIIYNVNSIFCGSNIIFFGNKFRFNYIILYASIWTFTMSFISTYVFYMLHIIDRKYVLYFYLSVISEAILSLFLHLLLSQKKINLYNKINLLRLFLYFGFFIILEKTIYNWLLSYFLSYLITLIILLLIHTFESNTKKEFSKNKIFYFIFKKGIQNEISNLFSNLNYRLFYFVIEKSFSSQLGIIVLITQLVEASLIIPKSLAMLQYSTLSNINSKKIKMNISVLFYKISVLSSIAFLILLHFIPQYIIEFIFKVNLENYTIYLLILSFSTLFISSTQITIHFISSFGKFYKHLIVNSFGLLFLSFSYIIIYYFYSNLYLYLLIMIFTNMLIASMSYSFANKIYPWNFFPIIPSISTIKDIFTKI